MNRLAITLIVVAPLMSAMLAAAPPAKPAKKGTKARTAAGESVVATETLTPRVFLIRDPFVHNDLKASATQKEALVGLANEVNESVWKLRDIAGDSPAGSQEISRINGTVRERLETILSSSQRDRLGEIVLQVQGTSALGQPGLSADLSLTPAQKQEISRISSTAEAALAKIRQQANGTKNLVELNRQAEKLQTDLQRDLIASVTPEQQQRWLALRGRDIDLKKLEPLIAMAPELRDVQTWINSEPLTLERLRGQVVALHFWTFGCINCIHNYPSYKHWYEEFNGKGLTIVGVHTPETEGEKVIETIRRRARENDLAFPIAVDGQLKNWQAWSNNIWPAVYLIDKKGHVRYWWYGELNWQGAEGEAYMRSKIIELMAEK